MSRGEFLRHSLCDVEGLCLHRTAPTACCLLARLERNGELRTVEPSVKVCVKSHCEAAAAMMAESACFDIRPSNPNRHLQFRQLRQVVESYVMEELQKPIFRWLEKWHTQQTEQLGKQLSSMMAMTQEALGVKPEFRTNYESARVKLCQLQEYRTPLEKLQCLRDVIELIKIAVESHLDTMGIPVGTCSFSMCPRRLCPPGAHHVSMRVCTLALL